MAFTRVTITEAQLAFYYGFNVAAGGSTADASDFFVSTSEAYLTALLKFDLIANWASLTANFKQIFTEYLGRMAAVSAVMFDPNSYTDGIEAENIVKVHWQRALDIQDLLINADVKDFTIKI